MRGEAALFADTLERTGRLVLQQLKNVPEVAFYWPVPLSEYHSLFDFATRLIETSELWVQIALGGRTLERDSMLAELYTNNELASLFARYEYWLLNLHVQLDNFPDDLMNMFIILPAISRHTLGEGPVTVRTCLLYAIEQSALQSGYIQLLCQMYAELEQLQEDFSREYSESGMPLEMMKGEQLN